MKKTAKKTKRFLALLAALCMILTMALPVMAEEGGTLIATDDPRESIMMLKLGYEDDKGEFYEYKRGTCFLINDEYVLTNRHVVTLLEPELNNGVDELEEFRTAPGIGDVVPDDIERNDPHIKLYLYVNRDMKVAATMHESVNSKDMDFAAVKLAEKIYDRKPIALGDSSAVQTKDIVFALGYPADSESTKDYNTKDDVSTVDGMVSKLTVTGNVDVIEHTAPLNFGNSGGPLLDENNNVIGVNTSGAGKKAYSIQINYIKNGLDTFGIPYVSADVTTDGEENTDNTDTEETGEEAEEPEVPDNTVYLADLQSVLDEAKAIETKDYTEESVAALDDSIGAAESVLKNTAADIATIQGATDDLNDAIANLEEKSGPNMMMIAIIGVIAIIIIVIIIVVVASSGKKKKKAVSGSTPGKGGQTPMNGGPVPMNGGPAPMPYSSGNETAPAGGAAVPPMPNAMPEGAGETTLLDSGAGETTLLSNAGSAYLIRKKNGEKISINSQSFKIGKERRRVNYCISDNTSVSRVHCEIVKKGADYYAVDQGATNFTFVNGVQLSPRQETLLSDQSILKLSDEEFEFHLS